jgi:Zn-dependent M28 family amino/carboxypeptidase
MVRAEDPSQRLRRHVYVLSQEIGERNIHLPEALHAAEGYIAGCWRGQGYTVERQAYRVEGVRSANLEITCPGTSGCAGLILLGAHYDSVPGSPGADDNASGVAALLELSRLLKDDPAALAVRLVAFTNEEPPYFFTHRQGSMVYARRARERGDDIRLMLSLEMLGCYSDQPGSQRYPPLLRRFYPDRGDFIALVSNLRSRRQLRRFAAAFRAASDFPCEHAAIPAWVPGVAWSDHLSFWRHGYRALMVTDTAFYRYRWYHTGGDTPEKLDYPRLARVTAALHGALLRSTLSS